MSRNGFAAVASLVLVLGSVFGASRQTWAQDAKTQYPSMAPLDQYLMADRNAEIALARSAAPTSISSDATILVFDKSGYQTAGEGKNGFTCLVERSWMSPFDSPEFWNPKMRGPICYNPAAVRTILPYTVNRTRLALTGLSKAQIRENITAAIAKNELPIPEAGAMSYMLSKAGNLGDSVGHWCPHLMVSCSQDKRRGLGSRPGGLTGVVQRRISRRSGAGNYFHGSGFPLVRRHRCATSGI
jgi:hypothetical protein